MEDFRIPKKQIARSTAEDKGLGGVDIAAKDRELRYVITVQALKEGWDCPFAYILCSVAELRSSTAVEQVLGRIMRLPNVRKKTRPELNVAYAFTASTSFAEAATALPMELANRLTRNRRFVFVPWLNWLSGWRSSHWLKCSTASSMRAVHLSLKLKD